MATAICCPSSLPSAFEPLTALPEASTETLMIFVTLSPPPSLLLGIIFLLIQGVSELLKSYWASKKGEWPGENK